MQMTQQLRQLVLEAKAWTDSSPAGYAARPYVEGLLAVPNGGTAFHQDDVCSMVTYLVGNLRGWRGARAALVKADLRAFIARKVA